MIDMPALALVRLAAGGSSTTALVVGLLGASGFGAIVAAIIAGFFSKRKLGAEATEIITKAAAGVVTNLQDELKRQREAFDEAAAKHVAQVTEMAAEHGREIARREADHAREMEEVRRVLQLHVAWDTIAIAKVTEMAAKMGDEVTDVLPPPPPLLPPDHTLRSPRGTMGE